MRSTAFAPADGRFPRQRSQSRVNPNFEDGRSDRSGDAASPKGGCAAPGAFFQTTKAGDCPTGDEASQLQASQFWFSGLFAAFHRPARRPHSFVTADERVDVA